ncbi:MAG: hypothetical protein ABH848_05555 [Candidatus Omnitrophota bacterium]
MRDTTENSFYHWSNLALILLVIFSIRSLTGVFISYVLFLGLIVGFFVSWHIKDIKIRYIGAVINILSVVMFIFIMGEMLRPGLTFFDIIRTLSLMLAWFAFLKSFNIKGLRDYGTLQIMSVTMLILFASLKMERDIEHLHIVLLFFFIFIFTMRMNLRCEKVEKDSFMADRKDRSSIVYNDLGLAVILFLSVILIATLLYPFIPKKDNFSVDFLPKMIPSAFIQKISENLMEKIDFDDMMQKKLPRDKSPQSSSEPSTASSSDLVLESTPLSSSSVSSSSISASESPASSSSSLSSAPSISVDAISPSSSASSSSSSSESSSPSSSVAPETVKIEEEEEEYEPELLRKINWWLILLLLLLLPFLIWLVLLILVPLLIMFLPYILVAIYLIRTYIRRYVLSKKAKDNPKEFVMDIYRSLRNSLRFYGLSITTHQSHMELYDELKKHKAASSEYMHKLTTNALEASFSNHLITKEHSKEALTLFKIIRYNLLNNRESTPLWRRIFFKLAVLDITLVSEEF